MGMMFLPLETFRGAGAVTNEMPPDESGGICGLGKMVHEFN